MNMNKKQQPKKKLREKKNNKQKNTLIHMIKTSKMIYKINY